MSQRRGVDSRTSVRHNVSGGAMRVGCRKWKSLMIGASDRQSGEPIAALDRHDERRRSGVPTVSVLVGPTVSTMRVVSQWAAAVRRSTVFIRSEERDLRSVVVPWMNEVAKDHDLGAAAVRWLRSG